MGFTYNNIHSSTLGITRVISNRYDDNLVPTLKDITADIIGVDGKVYFGTNYTKREISVSFAFVDLTEKQMRDMYILWNGKQIHDLIFDEWPYKVYSAKIIGNSTVKHLSFGEGDDAHYSGEGTVKFCCYFPFARSRYNWQEDYDISTIPEWQPDDDWNGQVEETGNIWYDFDEQQNAIGALQGALSEFVWVHPQSLLINVTDNDPNDTENGGIVTYTESPYINYNDWIEASKIPSHADYGTYDDGAHCIKLFNAGDVLMPSRWWFRVPDNPTSYTIGDLVITNLVRSRITSPTQAGADYWFVVDMPNHQIQGYDRFARPTGRLYNHFITNGTFFGIPLGEQTITCSQKPYDIEFNYLYL